MRISIQEFEEILTELLGERAEAAYADIPSGEELAGIITYSPRFERRMSKLMRRPKAYIKTIRRPIHLKALRIVASILLAITILFGTLMAIPSARAYILRIIQNWFEDHNRYTFTEPGSTVGNWTIAYIPQGYSLVTKDEGIDDTFCLYSNGIGEILLVQIYGSDMGLDIDNENYTYSEIRINDIKADVYKNKADYFPDIIILNHEDENTIISIQGVTGIEELTAIAESIKKN